MLKKWRIRDEFLVLYGMVEDVMSYIEHVSDEYDIVDVYPFPSCDIGTEDFLFVILKRRNNNDIK